MASDTGSQPPEHGAAADPPSVETEIVDAEFVEEPGTITPDEAKTGPGEPPRQRPPLSQGLLFFAGFIILAAGVFAAFTFSRPGPEQPAAEVQQADETAPPSVAEQIGEGSARPSTDASKIVNSGLDEAKAAAALDSSALPPSARGLPPPPPPGSANDELQRAAKEAARQFGPDSGDAIDKEPAQPSQPPIEFQTESAITPEDSAMAQATPSAPPEESAAQPGSVEMAALTENFDRELALQSARSNAEIESLRAEIERLQQGNPHTSDTRDPSAYLALAALERTIERGAPFAQELDEFARLAPGAPPIERLRPMATTGAPPLAVLQDEFDPAARAAIAAAARETATGWFGGVAARVQEIVSVRPARPVAGSAPAQIISRAEGALETGNLSNAAAEAETLRGAAALEFAPWLERARMRLAADEAVAALNATFLTVYQN